MDILISYTIISRASTSFTVFTDFVSSTRTRFGTLFDVSFFDNRAYLEQFSTNTKPSSTILIQGKSRDYFNDVCSRHICKFNFCAIKKSKPRFDIILKHRKVRSYFFSSDVEKRKKRANIFHAFNGKYTFSQFDKFTKSATNYL